MSGDCNGNIFLTDFNSSKNAASSNPFKLSQRCSIEDLAWSPSELNVFAGSATGGRIGLWDVRNASQKAVLEIEASQQHFDINVISWNANTQYLLASGDDSGAICSWDLRCLKPSSKESNLYVTIYCNL